MSKMRAISFVVALVLLGLWATATPAVTITSDSSSESFDGVRVVEGRTSGPSTDFYAAYISLCNDYVHVDASSYDGARTAGSYASTSGADLAVNGDFFYL